MSGDVYREGRVWVRSSPCDRCLFSPARLVGPARVRELIETTRATDGGSFICHRHQVHAGEPATICAAWWERYADEDWRLRLASGLGIVERWP